MACEYLCIDQPRAAVINYAGIVFQRFVGLRDFARNSKKTGPSCNRKQIDIL